MSAAPIEPDIPAVIKQIDGSIDQMIRSIESERDKLVFTFDVYIERIQYCLQNSYYNATSKFEWARNEFESAKKHTNEFNGMIERLRNIKRVNRMVDYALKDELVSVFDLKFSLYIDSVTNVCLAQLKYVMTTYKIILEELRSRVTAIWMDRKIADAVKIFLAFDKQNFEQFQHHFKNTEVLYADLGLFAHQKDDNDDFHQRIVLRMISNRLQSAAEIDIIRTLFPEWDNSRMQS